MTTISATKPKREVALFIGRPEPCSPRLQASQTSQAANIFYPSKRVNLTSFIRPCPYPIHTVYHTSPFFGFQFHKLMDIFQKVKV